MPIREYVEDGTALMEGPEPVIQRVKRVSQYDLKSIVWLAAPAVLGLFLIWFGLTTTGSYFMPASKFGGVLAQWFYGYQIGTLLAVIGGILIYDAVKRSGYL